MQIKYILITLLLVILFFALGILAGVYYQSQNDSIHFLKSGQFDKLSENIKSLGSNVITSINATGRVAKIEGNNVTLTSVGSSITFSVAKDTDIYVFGSQSGVSVNTGDGHDGQLSLKDVKVGDNLNVSIKVLPDGSIVTHSMIVLPPTLKTSTK